LTVAEATALVRDALVANKTSPENAASVAEALIAAELTGQGGHGLRRVAAYAAQARAGKVDGFATPTAERVRPGAVRIDAAHGFAFPALTLACDALAAMAPETGIAIAGIMRSQPGGVAGLTVRTSQRRGVVTL